MLPVRLLARSFGSLPHKAAEQLGLDLDLDLDLDVAKSGTNADRTLWINQGRTETNIYSTPTPITVALAGIGAMADVTPAFNTALKAHNVPPVTQHTYSKDQLDEFLKEAYSIVSPSSTCHYLRHTLTHCIRMPA